MNFNFDDNWNWQLKYQNDIIKILENLPNKYFGHIEVAPPDKDIHQATDFNFKMITDKGNIACRIRRNNVCYRDWSVRYINKNCLTEIHKLREGYGNYYFYGWCNAEKEIYEWVLIDLEKVRKLNLLKDETIKKMKWSIKNNYLSGHWDGTAGLYIPIRYLNKVGCICEYHHSNSYLQQALKIFKKQQKPKKLKGILKYCEIKEEKRSSWDD